MVEVEGRNASLEISTELKLNSFVLFPGKAEGKTQSSFLLPISDTMGSREKPSANPSKGEKSWESKGRHSKSRPKVRKVIESRKRKEIGLSQIFNPNPGRSPGPGLRFQ